MSEKPLKRDDEVPYTTTTDGAALGVIPVTTVMLDRASTVELINAAVSGGWKAGGSLDADQIVSSLLVSTNEGKVYNVNEAFTTTSDFIEGEGKWYAAGTNIAVIEATPASGETPATYKFDVLGGTDQSVIRQIVVTGLSTLIPTNGSVTLPLAKANYSGVVKLNDSLTATYGENDGYAATPNAVYLALSSAKDYTDVLSTALDTRLSGIDESISTLSTNVGTLSTGKADKVASATAGNFAGLDANGNLTDSGSKAADFEAAGTAAGLIAGLDYTATGMGAGKTISTLTETDGVISATFQDIAITQSQITDFHTGLSAALAQIGNTTPTTVNQTISVLMDLITALKAIV